MKREETVEEVEKNTELERQTPKRNVVSSSLAGGAKGAKTRSFGSFFALFDQSVIVEIISKEVACFAYIFGLEESKGAVLAYFCQHLSALRLYLRLLFRTFQQFG